MLLLGRGPLDRSIYESLYAGSSPALTLAARFFTFLGEPTVLVGGGFLIAAGLWHRGRGRFALGLLLVILLGRGLSEVQKYWIARARPDFEAHLVVVKTSSFPSGHATSSMIFYLVLALALAPRGWRRPAAAAAILLSFLVGTSRVMLGVHWPSDVIGGWSFGLLWVLATLPAAERLFRTDSATAGKQPITIPAEGEGGMSRSKPFTWIAAAIFALMAVVHIARVATNFQITVGSHSIPMWVSYVAILITAFLSWMLCREARAAAPDEA